MRREDLTTSRRLADVVAADCTHAGAFVNLR